MHANNWTVLPVEQSGKNPRRSKQWEEFRADPVPDRCRDCWPSSLKSPLMAQLTQPRSLTAAAHCRAHRLNVASSESTPPLDISKRLDCLTQVDRWRHSVSDVVEYVTTEKVTRICFQHTSCIHTQVGNSNKLGLYWLITSYFEVFFLKERMNVSDSLHKLRISHRMSFSHYKQNTRVSEI
jgi:hypothetical protein